MLTVAGGVVRRGAEPAPPPPQPVASRATATGSDTSAAFRMNIDFLPKVPTAGRPVTRSARHLADRAGESKPPNRPAHRETITKKSRRVAMSEHRDEQRPVVRGQRPPIGSADGGRLDVTPPDITLANGSSRSGAARCRSGACAHSAARKVRPSGIVRPDVRRWLRWRSRWGASTARPGRAQARSRTGSPPGRRRQPTTIGATLSAATSNVASAVGPPSRRPKATYCSPHRATVTWAEFLRSQAEAGPGDGLHRDRHPDRNTPVHRRRSPPRRQAACAFSARPRTRRAARVSYVLADGHHASEEQVVRRFDAQIQPVEGVDGLQACRSCSTPPAWSRCRRRRPRATRAP